MSFFRRVYLDSLSQPDPASARPAGPSGEYLPPAPASLPWQEPQEFSASLGQSAEGPSIHSEAIEHSAPENAAAAPGGVIPPEEPTFSQSVPAKAPLKTADAIPPRASLDPLPPGGTAAFEPVPLPVSPDYKPEPKQTPREKQEQQTMSETETETETETGTGTETKTKTETGTEFAAPRSFPRSPLDSVAPHASALADPTGNTEATLPRAAARPEAAPAPAGDDGKSSATPSPASADPSPTAPAPGPPPELMASTEALHRPSPETGPPVSEVQQDRRPTEAPSPETLPAPLVPATAAARSPGAILPQVPANESRLSSAAPPSPPAAPGPAPSIRIGQIDILIQAPAKPEPAPVRTPSNDQAWFLRSL